MVAFPVSEELCILLLMAVCSHIIGETPVPLWGLSSRERYRLPAHAKARGSDGDCG
jgi:hypothetical protein